MTEPGEQHKAIFLRFAGEVVNRGNLGAIDEIVATNIRVSFPLSPDPLSGPEAVKRIVSTMRTAFPDLHVEPVEMLAEGDRLVVRGKATGTNTGELMGLPPTGRPATWQPVHFCRFRKGRIAEWQVSFDRLDLLQQLGLAQAPKPPAPVG